MAVDKILIFAFALYAIAIVVLMFHQGMFRGLKRDLTVLANTLGGLTQIDEPSCPDWADPVKWEESLR